VKYRRVKVGVLREGKRVVRDGLAANERVIVTGLQRVKPGDKVNVRPYVAATMTSSSKSAGEAKKPAAATSPNPMTSKSETGNAEAKPGEAKAPMPPSS
jgi:membrane fusion protein, multidrug efflux system